MRFIELSTVGAIGVFACGVLPFTAVSKSPNSENSANSVATPKAEEPVNKSVAALQQKVAMLERGAEFLKTVESYTATVKKQEMVDGNLLDEQTVQLKCRHRPFSVYLYWQTGDPGREVIYVAGKNKGRMIAHDGGWKAKIPAFSLDPNCSLAMRDARYPATEAGLLGLLDNMLAFHREDLSGATVASCEVDTNQEFEGRPCLVFTTHYKSRDVSPIYRKSITYMDREWNVPVYTRHYQWPADTAVAEADLDGSTLIERYAFTDIHLGAPLTAADFDRTNSEYSFH